jgi:hypothetical protein
LGKDPQIEKAMIRWPSGAVQTLPASQLKVGAVNEVKEPQ